MLQPTRVWTALTLAACLLQFPPAAKAAALDPRALDVFTRSMTWMDGRWDDRAALLRTGSRHNVRETAWYAAGLLLRDAPGDRARAARAIEAVLDQQISLPLAPYDGTFYRTPEEPQPPGAPQMWVDYDPNWRAFIGTTFALILNEYEQRLPTPLRNRMLASIRRAVEGELKEGRLRPSYTNIALMHGYLLAYAGARLQRPEWSREAEQWTRAVHDGFREHGTFEEFNSPTYYGVDLYGLALWRKYGPTDEMRRMGAEMEAALWRDIASFYHAGLRNLAGPYDRAYGLDMRGYASLVGLWLRLKLDGPVAPFPALDRPMLHDGDFAYTPCFVLLGAAIPADAMPHFERFQGERQVTRQLPRDRIATAWLESNLMIGAEVTRKQRGAGSPRNQLMPAVIHWKLPSGEVGYAWLASAPRLDARAEKGKLSISATGDCTFRIVAAGASASAIQKGRWQLPGLSVDVVTDATGFSVGAGPGSIEVTYRDATAYALSIRSE